MSIVQSWTRYRVVTVTMSADVATLAEALVAAGGRPAVIFKSTGFGVWCRRPFLVVQGESL